MRIALIEPSRTIRRIVTGIIKPWGHEVHSFMDAPEGLAFLQAEKDIRAVISSVKLGPMCGIQLAGEARALAGVERPLYIILMSSNAERARMNQAFENGADDFISKPPAVEELRARLRAAERATSMQAELIVLVTFDSLTGLLNRRALSPVPSGCCNMRPLNTHCHCLFVISTGSSDKRHLRSRCW